MAVKISLDYKDFIDLSEFFTKWGVELSKSRYQDMLMDEDVIDVVTDFVVNEIKQATDSDKFAVFMAERTYVQPVQTSRGVTFHIGGRSEKWLKENGKEDIARISNDAIAAGKDYNLWENYEFHGKGITGVTLGTPGTKGSNSKIVKDAGGVVTVKKKSGEAVDLKGRSGLIGTVVTQLQGELAIRLADLLGSKLEHIIASAADDAANVARDIEGMNAAMSALVIKAAKKYDVDVAKMTKSGIRATVTSQGRITTRSSTGQFVSSALHGKMVR